MKVSGPKGPGPLDGPAIEKTNAGSRAEKQRFADAVGGTKASPVSGTDAAPGSIEALARELRAGRIAPEEALNKLVEATVAKRGAKLPEALRQQMEQMLKEFVGDDPMLAASLANAAGKK